MGPFQKCYFPFTYDTPLKTAIVVCDPVSSRTSVQFGLVSMVIKSLGDYYRIKVFTPFISTDKAKKFREDANVAVHSLSEQKPLLNMVYRALERNEAMLWSVSWLLEVLFSANSSLMTENVNKREDEIIVNLAYTVPAASSLYWNQAAPPLKTLQMMDSNPVAPLLSRVFGRFIEYLDRRLRVRLKKYSLKIANNSLYLKELYRGRELFSDEVIHVPRDFGNRKVSISKPARNYVLAYIGKEVETDTLIEMANRGIKIIAFGAKIPFGTPLGKIKSTMDFRGYVNDDELSDLYYNALYTAFPFTEEPFGWVPLESMFHGTPVLSYDKQGPSETLLDGKTGWLMKTKEEFVQKAFEIWSSRNTEMSASDCMERAESFSLKRTGDRLIAILNNNAEVTIA